MLFESGWLCVVVVVDECWVVRLLCVVKFGEMLGIYELLLELMLKNGCWIVVIDVWFFCEGDELCFCVVCFGEFCVLVDGWVLLVGLVDELFCLIWL